MSGASFVGILESVVAIMLANGIRGCRWIWFTYEPDGLMWNSNPVQFTNGAEWRPAENDPAYGEEVKE